MKEDYIPTQFIKKNICLSNFFKEDFLKLLYDNFETDDLSILSVAFIINKESIKDSDSEETDILLLNHRNNKDIKNNIVKVDFNKENTYYKIEKFLREVDEYDF